METFAFSIQLSDKDYICFSAVEYSFHIVSCVFVTLHVLVDYFCIDRVRSGHGSLIQTTMWVGSGRVRLLVGRMGSGPKKVTRVQLWGNDQQSYQRLLQTSERVRFGRWWTFWAYDV